MRYRRLVPHCAARSRWYDRIRFRPDPTWRRRQLSKNLRRGSQAIRSFVDRRIRTGPCMDHSLLRACGQRANARECAWMMPVDASFLKAVDFSAAAIARLRAGYSPRARAAYTLRPFTQTT